MQRLAVKRVSFSMYQGRAVAPLGFGGQPRLGWKKGKINPPALHSTRASMEARSTGWLPMARYSARTGASSDISLANLDSSVIAIAGQSNHRRYGLQKRRSSRFASSFRRRGDHDSPLH